MRNPLDVGNFRLDLPCPEENFCKSFIKIDRNRMAKTVAFHLLCVLRAFWNENLICKYLNKEIINILCGKILQNSYYRRFLYFLICAHMRCNFLLDKITLLIYQILGYKLWWQKLSNMHGIYYDTHINLQIYGKRQSNNLPNSWLFDEMQI